MSTLHDTNFYLWTQQQAVLLRTGDIAALDIDNIIEEIEDMGISNRRALSSHFIILLAHLLKWEFQPEHRCSSWRGSIVEQRVQIEDLLEHEPSLKTNIAEIIDRIYPKALKIASKETGIAINKFPKTSPYQREQIMDDDFWPK